MADALSRGDVTASLPQTDDSEKGNTFDAVIATADVAASTVEERSRIKIRPASLFLFVAAKVFLVRLLT